MVARRSVPSEAYEQTSRRASARAYADMPSTHWARPNSAGIGARAWGADRSKPRRYRFHQPLRSEAKKTAELSGAHSGWKIDSSGPPARTSGLVAGLSSVVT